MKIIELSETGLALPDAEVDQFASAVLFQKSDFNIVVSNFLVILALRAKLFAIEVDKRPKIKFIIYGKEVVFDKDMRSFDLDKDERTQLVEKYLYAII